MTSPTDRSRRQDASSRPVTARSTSSFIAAVLVAAALAGLALLAVQPRGTADRPSAASPDAAASNPARPVQPPRSLLGVGSCTSSGCHASAVEGHAAWQSSYTVWATRDPHTQAERVLHEPLAAQIVTLLAARDPSRPIVPAHEHTACIGCHATGRGPTAREGVSCESCHGPAGDWLVAHAVPGWRAAGNTQGMVDLADPFVCAQQCAGCHVGGPLAADGSPREVSHDLIAAGHPRLAFELRSFKEAEPPHWRDRFAAAPASAAASAPGSTALDPLDEWALGRLGAVHAFLDQIARQAGASTRPWSGTTADTWPEFTAFDCYSCHRPPVAAVDRGETVGGADRPTPLGTPRLEPLHWSLLDLLVQGDTAARLTSLRRDIEHRWWERPDAATILACLDAIDAARAHVQPALAGMSAGTVAERMVRQIDPANWDEATAAHAALEAVIARAAAHGVPAESLVAAVARLNTLRGLLEFPGDTTGGKRRFDSPHDYDAKAVAAELRGIAAALEAVR
jgi:hypothetical protein